MDLPTGGHDGDTCPLELTDEGLGHRVVSESKEWTSHTITGFLYRVHLYVISVITGPVYLPRVIYSMSLLESREFLRSYLVCVTESVH